MNSIVRDLTWQSAPVTLAAAAARVATLWPDEVERAGPAFITDPAAKDASLIYFKGDEDADYAAYDPEAGAILKRSAWDARALIAQGAPNASAIVEVALVRIACRRDRLNPHPHSSSWRSRPGLAAITNGELSIDATLFIANALVHEAIHSALYCHEQDAPFTHGEAGAIRLISPWTGASLRLPSFLHACHVWFGLAWFWDAITKVTGPSCEADYYFERARTGFDRNLFQQLNPSCDRISHEAFSAVCEMPMLLPVMR